MTDATPVHEVVIIGAGFSGLGMAIKLEQAGIRDFVILERDHEVGGTWRDNRYPGAACDVASHLYSYSFEQNPDWSRAYAEQPEIQRYILRCTEKYGLRPYIRFGTSVRGARFDEDTGTWSVETDSGETLRARSLVSATGGLSNPALPKIAGIERFEGTAFHTAQWDASCDLAGKRVGVIGSGASAIQVVPAIAPDVRALSVFQRTPSWVMPKADRAMTEREKTLYRVFPPALWLRRLRIYWLGELRAPLLISNRDLFKHALARMGRRHIASQISDPALCEKLTPDYRVGCKRVLISNDWYPALERDDVELVTTGIREITPGGIVTEDGCEHEFDVLIFATGFEVRSTAGPFEVEGRSGVKLSDAWKHGAEAYKGVTVSGFPNLYLMVGPNTGPGHTSVLVYLEKQIDYAVAAIQLLRRRGLKFLDLRSEVQERFNRGLQRRMKKTVWTSGCKSWYLAPNGENHSLYPGFSFEYRLRTHFMNPRHYVQVPPDAPSSSAVGGA